MGELRKDLDVVSADRTPVSADRTQVSADRTPVRIDTGRVVEKYFKVKCGEKKNGKP